ncbi:MAG TPA: BACON domain-containing carbohydrate-binding protein, partial [Pyrinomonadaceae bacterium]
GSRPSPRVEGRTPLRGTVNYFNGGDPGKWVTGVPTYERVRYRGVYAGVDVEFYGNQRQLEYDFIVAPNASPGRIRLRFDGAERVRIDAATGDLLLGVAGGEIRQRKPFLYQLKGGVRREVRGRYALRGRGEVGFEVGAYDRRLPLVIDPVLVYSTYLGDGREDRAAAVAIDSAGSAYVVGDSETLGDAATRQVFVMKLSPAGSELEYAAHFGGAGEDTARAVAVDAKGNAAVVGETASSDFPVTANAYQPAPGRTFLVRLNETGGEMTYSTYFGGDSASGLAADEAGRLYVAGAAKAASLKTTPGVFQPNAADAVSQDAFVAKFDPALAGAASLVFSTFLGGAGQDAAAGLAVDPLGNVYVAGRTDSADFPLKNQLAAGRPGAGDAFLSKLNPAATSLLYSTLLAGEGADYAVGVALDSTERAHVAGVTHSDAFPVTASAVQPKKDLDTCTGADGSTVNCPDAFVTRIDTTKTGDAALLYSTYVGGAKEDTAAAVAVDAAGLVYVAGATSSLNFPVVNSTQDHLVVGDCGGGDGFLVKLNPARTGIDSLLFSTYLGGECDDAATGVAADREGNAFISGRTLSREFPVLAPAQADAGGHGDAFAAKLDTDPDAGCQYALAPASRSFTNAGGGGSSNLTTAADCAWELSTDDPWITLTSAASGSGNKTITFTVAPNLTADNRSGTIDLVGAGNVKRAIAISQSGCYAISPASKSVGPDAATGSVTVTAGASCAGWTAASNVPWITITAGAGGTGNGTVAYSVAPNTSADARQGKLTIAGKTHTVNQAGCYAITPSSRTFGPDAGTGTVGVTAGDSCAGWTAASNVPWITITSGGGATGDATVTYSVAPNSELLSRTGTLTVAGKTHSVTQLGCFALSPSSWEFGPGNGNGSVNVTAGSACPGWTAVSNHPWITVTSAAGGSGNGTVTYSVAANTSGASRNGSLTIAGRTHSVRQLGCYGISPSSKSAGPNAQTGSVSVSAGPACAPWTAESDAPWLTVTSAVAGTNGLGTVNYSVEATTSDAARTGRIKIGDKTFTVTQAACSVLSPSADAAPDFPSTGTINVTFGTACSPWAAVSNAPWIVIVSGGTGAAGTSKVTYSVKANLDAGPRTGTITVGPRTFTVTQAGDPTPQRVVQFGAPSFQHGEEAVGATVTVTRTGDATTPVSVGFTTMDDPAAVPCATANGTAYARCDYATTIDTVHFAAGETQKQIAVPVIDDAHVEGAEVLRLRLVNPTGGATLGPQSTATLTIRDNDQPGAAANPVDQNAMFVRMQYLDFLSREPEAGEPWTGVLDRCPNVNGDASCDRLLVSQSFFQSHEFYLKALYSYLFYRVAFNRRPTYEEITPDMRSLAGATADEVFARRAAYAAAVAQRTEFAQLYPTGMTNQRYVDTLLGRHGLQRVTTEDPTNFEGTSQVTLTRQQLIDALNSNALTRAQVLRAVVQSSEVDAAEYHGAFVSMQYYGYLRRTPEESGYQAWLKVIKENPDNIRQMVSGFVNSQEYRLRFGQP